METIKGDLFCKFLIAISMGHKQQIKTTKYTTHSYPFDAFLRGVFYYLINVHDYLSEDFLAPQTGRRPGILLVLFIVSSC